MKTLTKIEKAMEIMQNNFLGKEDAIRHFEICSLQKSYSLLQKIIQKNKDMNIPFSEKILIEKKESHILTFVTPISIMEIQNKYSDLFYFRVNPWYKDEEFANIPSEEGWYLIPKDWIPAGKSNTINNIEKLNEAIYKAATASIIVYTIISYFLKTGERLLKNDYTRTSSRANFWEVDIGYFGKNDANGKNGGLFISQHWGRACWEITKVAEFIRP